MHKDHGIRRICAGILAAGLIISLAQAQPGPTGNPDLQSARASSVQAQKDESLAPRALGRHARLDEPDGKSRRSLWPWIIGGAVVAGAVAAYFLFIKPKDDSPQTGEIYVESFPTGAEITLDGGATGKVSNVLLPGVSPGSHTVNLSKDGYRDFTATVTVVAGKRALVQANLEPSAIAVTAPAADTYWVKGDAAIVRWTVDASAVPSFAEGTGVLNVRIELYRGGSKVATISESTPNDGSESWTVPMTIDPAGGYIVRVSCVGQESASGSSSPFILAIRKTETFTWHSWQEHSAQFRPSGTARAEQSLSGNGKIESVTCEAWLTFRDNVVSPEARLSDVGLIGPGGIWQPIPFEFYHDSGPDPIVTVIGKGSLDDRVGKTKAGKWVFSATYRCPCANPDYEGGINSVYLTLTYLQWM